MRLLNGSINKLDYKELRGSGYVVHSLESSIWCLLNTENYKDAVLKAIHLGEDTDTTAAITGGLAALCFGFSSIPSNWVSDLVKSDEIRKLANKLSEKYTLKIRLENVPKIGDISAANKFAHKYSGYRISFKETANSALATKRSIELNETEHITVDELAQSLFFHFRAVRHGGGDANEEVVNSHLSLIREKLMNQEKKAR